MDAIDIMNSAEAVVSGHSNDRDKGKERAMADIVKVFNLLTGNNISEYEGDIFMACLKLVRMQRNKDNPDHYVDLCGYISMAGESETK